MLKIVTRHRKTTFVTGLLLPLSIVASVFILMAPMANASCTLGCRSCQGGFEYTCEACGSETCWIMNGKKCSFSNVQCLQTEDLQSSLPIMQVFAMPQLMSTLQATPSDNIRYVGGMQPASCKSAW